MDNYISRKTAYQFFKDQLEEETGAYSKGRNAGLRVAMSAVMNNDAIPAADVRPRWIPVTERLPKEDGCYLVAVKNDHQRRYSKTAWFSHDSWFARQDVTHWMPLPEPPKEE